MARKEWGWNTRSARHDERARRESEREHGRGAWSEPDDDYGNRPAPGWGSYTPRDRDQGQESGRDLGTARSWYGDDRGDRERYGSETHGDSPGRTDYARARQTEDGPSYVGRGPKNWRRSDERIREDINEQLERHPRIDATDVDVQVRDGEVTLSGEVSDRRMKRLAEDVVDEVAGVLEVHNQIRVKRDGVLSNLFGERDRTGSSASEHDA